MKKRKIRSVFWRELLKGEEFIHALVNFATLAIIILITVLFTHKFNFSSLLDIGTFTAVISAFILNFISNAIFSAYKKNKEDERKLTTDYDNLTKIYLSNAKALEYANCGADAKNTAIGRKNTSCTPKDKESDEADTYKIPIADIISLKDKEVVFNNENYRKIYSHPEKIDGLIDDMMKAHSYSKTYNQLMIRCDKIEESAASVKFSFSKTTYYESLVTNRAIDFSVKGRTVRDLCAYGPYLMPLEDSELSNHMGYNGFVETSDEKIVFIFRNKYVSIAKNTMQSSIGASLKVKYACSDSGKVTKEGVVYAMKKEIEDELCLEKLENYKSRKEKIFDGFGFENILYFYRELVEGGKPQLMFYTKIPLTSAEIKTAYTKGVKNIKKGNFYCSVDGFKMLFVDKKDLKKIYITPDSMTIDGVCYKSVPTSTGTLALLIKHLSENGEI